MDSLKEAADAAALLDSVLCTDQLERRPSRPADHESEIRALLGLVEELKNAPRRVLQQLVDTALELCPAHSSGIALLEDAGRGLSPKGDHFRWHAVAGQWSAVIRDTTIQRDRRHDGSVLDRKHTLLFTNAHRYFREFASVQLLLAESLLAPLHVDGQLVGTLWVVAHDDNRKFDAEDRRVLENLATFGATAYQVLVNLNVTEQLEPPNAFLAGIVRSSDDAIITKDLDGVITSWNDGAQQVFGYSADEAIGRPITMLIPPDRSDEESNILARIRRGERIDHYETVRCRKDGTLRNISLTISPLRDAQGRITGASKIARDITQRKQTADKLRESEERFAQFMKHLPGLAWIKDAEGRYVYANDAAETAFGARGAELMGKTDRDLFPPETAAQFATNDRRALASGSGIQTIETLQQADGVHHSIVSKFPIPGPNGRDVMIGGVAFDITEQIQVEEALRESEKRFRLLADSAPVLIWVNGFEGCEFVNRAYAQFVGRPTEELQQMQWATALHPDDAEAYLSVYRRAFADGKPFEAQVRFRRADGEYRWMKSAGLPRFGTDGRFLGYVGCSLDITDIKQYQEALSEADRHKNEFLAMLAHELRNPLAPMRHALEILRLTNGNLDALQMASQMMDRQIDQMVRLVDDLLDVSRISRGTIDLRFETIELSSAVHHAVEIIQPLCEGKSLNLTVTLPPQPIYLNADPVRLAQVLGNLLNNACKFTDTGGRIWLTAELPTGGDTIGGSQTLEDPVGNRVTLVATSDSTDESANATTKNSSISIPHVAIRVRDTGIGIAPDQISRIFEMFAQIDTSLERTRSGLGVGLTLAKKLVELHGGTMEVASAGVGRGSEFVARLPIVQRPTRKKPESTVSEPSSAPTCRILVVDDNLDSAESLSLLLTICGYQTYAVYDGLAAVESAANFLPDIVLLDIGLPVLNGYEVASRIRGEEWGKEMVLIALTGWGQQEDRRRSKEAGFDHHLTKPVDPDALKALLAGLSVS